MSRPHEQSIWSLPIRFKAQVGLWRSLLLYYGIPFRQRRITTFYRNFIKPGDLCFDIGAHVGNRLGPWTALGARVVAIEPQPLLMGFLKRRFGQDPGISLVEEAVGERLGNATMFVSTRNPTVTTLSPVWINQVKQDQSFAGVNWDQKWPVRITTVDTLIARYGQPSLCKIDVEGYELQVLRGLSFPVPTLSFEYIPAALSLAEQCVLELERIGQYVFNWSIGEQHRLQSRAWLAAGDMVDRLRNELRHGRSGDIFARLNSS